MMRLLFDDAQGGPAGRLGAGLGASLSTLLLDTIRPGDAVMIKGSLATGMAPLVEALRARFTNVGWIGAPLAEDGMLFELVSLSDQIDALNVFRYITFRTGGAIMTALLFVFLFGPAMIDMLRVKQGKGQPIREDGPQTHFAKRGTPTMGGLMILSGITVATLLWANLSNCVRLDRAVRHARASVPSASTTTISR